MNEVQLLKSIFFHASEMALPDQRSAYLDSACAGNIALRREVDRMLDALSDQGQFLEPATQIEAVAGAETVRQPATAHSRFSFEPGAIIAGSYELIDQIGEGGMGTVWKARQRHPVNRLIAIKFVKAQPASRQVLERFERERHALAALDHPNIARIIDGGETQVGDPFVVMELVSGVPITDYCRARGLDLHKRLGLFRNVCQAIRHAHQKGIIHRDLKPNNILVAERDGCPEPKVIDFGLAKSLLDDPLVTSLSSGLSINVILGTPLYMPPERILDTSLVADVRDDVYSLGVLLYELLVGQPPIDPEQLAGLSLDQVILFIRDAVPTAPSKRLAALFNDSNKTDAFSGVPSVSPGEVRGELDWIILTAIAPDRQHRYASVEALISDITAYLDGEPITVAPPNHLYRARKLLKKHRITVTVSVLVFASLLAGISATTATMLWALREKQRATAAEMNAEQELSRAQAVKALITRMFDGITPQKAQGSDITILRSILDETATLLFAGEVEDPIVLAEMHQMIGDVFRQLGVYDSAERHLSLASELSTGVNGPEHEETLRTQVKLANVIYRRGRLDDASKLYQETYDKCLHVFGEQNPHTIGVLNNMAAVQFDQGRFQQAVEVFQQVLRLRQRVLGAEHEDTLATLNNLATVYKATDQCELAEQVYLQVRQVRERTLGLLHPATLNTLNSLANLYAQQERFNEAEGLYQRCLQLRTEVLGPDHPDTLASVNNLAQTFKDKGDLSEARAMYESLLETKIQSPSLGIDHPSTLQTMNNLAIVYADDGRLDEAESLYRKTLSARQKVLSNQHPDTLATMNNLAVLLEKQTRWSEAESMYVELLAIKRASLGETHRDTELSMLNLGNLYLAMGRMAESEYLYQTVLDQAIRRGHTEGSSYRRAQLGLERVRNAQQGTAP